MTSESMSQANSESAVVPQNNPEEGRRWLGSAGLLSSGVVIIVILLMGRAVVLWWKGDSSTFGETFSICLFLVFGLATFLSFWWIANQVERRFQSYFPAKKAPQGILTELRGLLFGSLSLPVVFAIIAVSNRGPQQQLRVAPRRELSTEKHVLSMEPGVQQRRDANLHYWKLTVADLHLIRFQTPSGQEAAEKYYEQMIQQLQQLTEVAKRTSTVNVDADLVQMAARHVAIEDELIQMKGQLDEFMKNEKLKRPEDTLDQRTAMSQLLLGSIQEDPNLIEKLPAGPIREWIKKGLRVEEQRQQQFRDIELMQAVLQERYRGTSFPLPTVDP